METCSRKPIWCTLLKGSALADKNSLPHPEAFSPIFNKQHVTKLKSESLPSQLVCRKLTVNKGRWSTTHMNNGRAWIISNKRRRAANESHSPRTAGQEQACRVLLQAGGVQLDMFPHQAWTHEAEQWAQEGTERGFLTTAQRPLTLANVTVNESPPSGTPWTNGEWVAAEEKES